MFGRTSDEPGEVLLKYEWFWSNFPFKFEMKPIIAQLQ